MASVIKSAGNATGFCDVAQSKDEGSFSINIKAADSFSAAFVYSKDVKAVL